MLTEQITTKKSEHIKEWNSDEYDSPESIKQWQIVLENDLLFTLCSQPFDRIPSNFWKMLKG